MFHRCAKARWTKFLTGLLTESACENYEGAGQGNTVHSPQHAYKTDISKLFTTPLLSSVVSCMATLERVDVFSAWAVYSVSVACRDMHTSI